MDKLIVYPTATSQWHALVTEASNKCSVQLSEEIESYLVFLLMRTINSTSLLQKIMALELLASCHELNNKKQQMLQTVGDSCLLFSGLFPGYARKCRVRVSYYVRLGQTAYDLLSTHVEQNCVSLFTSLCKYFVPLMDILQTMRELNDMQQSLDLLQAEEIWQDTNSRHALRVLQRFTSSPLLINNDLPLNCKH